MNGAVHGEAMAVASTPDKNALTAGFFACRLTTRLHVHQRGVGVCGIFTYEVAETKVNQVIDFAREHQHPLQCTMEKE